MDVSSQPPFVASQTLAGEALAAVCPEQFGGYGCSDWRIAVGWSRRQDADLFLACGGLRFFAMGIFQGMASLKSA